MKLKLSLLLLLIALVFSYCKKDSCKDVTCENGGTCVEGDCDCPDGFTGDNCEVNICNIITCLNGGTCNAGVCDCPDGFEGIYCQTIVDPCDNITCENGGTCVNGVCDCPNGFEGANCEEAIDPCVVLNCPPNSTCDGVYCICDLGYEGDSCHLEIRSKYLHDNYAAEDACPSGTYEYTVEIATSSEGVQYFSIIGFGGFSNPVFTIQCEILDSDNFQIPAQSHPGITNVQSTTIGSRNEVTGVISITYELALESGPTEVCELILTPQ